MVRTLLAALLAALVGGTLLWGPFTDAARDERLSVDTLEEIVGALEDSYVREVPREQLLRDAVKGMTEGLDAHTGYLSPQAFRNMKVNTEGEYGGLGLRVQPTEAGLIEVVSPIDDSPAARSRIQPGDLILRVGDTPVEDLDFTDAIERMRGRPGTTVVLGMRRGGDGAAAGETYDVELTRSQVTVEPVRARIFERIGYIRITNFNQRTAEALEAAIGELRQQAGGSLRGVVLDLRNNPGGLLDQAVEVSDLLLGEAEVVRVQGRGEDRGRVYSSDAGRVLAGVPMVVLINGGSASASEIVAGALQDHGRATVIGTNSFGKGSVQEIRPLDNGGALRLTTAHYVTPSGDRIGDDGLAPDIEVALQPDDGAHGDGAGSEGPARVGLEVSPDSDRQLRRALEHLRGEAG
jgi:carboxyl-terminal processing protease